MCPPVREQTSISPLANCGAELTELVMRERLEVSGRIDAVEYGHDA
jgi:hypothetical protein